MQNQWNPVNKDKVGLCHRIDTDSIPESPDEIYRLIFIKKNSRIMLKWRLKALPHWLTVEDEPHWQNFLTLVDRLPEFIYYASPEEEARQVNSLEEVDKEILSTYEKLAFHYRTEADERVAVDASSQWSLCDDIQEKLGELELFFALSERFSIIPICEKYLGSSSIYR